MMKRMMKKRDGTGPLGLGPKTGKGCGPCEKIGKYATNKEAQFEVTFKTSKDEMGEIVDKILKK